MTMTKRMTTALVMKPDTYFFPGYLAFAIWGPIMPPGFDEDYKAHVFFAVEQSKEKKKDGRNSIRKEQAEEEATSRSGMSASEGRGLSNKEGHNKRIELDQRLIIPSCRMSLGC